MLLGEALKLVKIVAKPAWWNFLRDNGALSKHKLELLEDGQWSGIGCHNIRTLTARVLSFSPTNEKCWSLFCKWFARCGRSSLLCRRVWLCHAVDGILSEAAQRPYGGVPAERFYDLCNKVFSSIVPSAKFEWRVSMARCLMSLHDYEWRPQPIRCYEWTEGITFFHSCVHRIVQEVENLR